MPRNETRTQMQIQNDRGAQFRISGGVYEGKNKQRFYYLDDGRQETEKMTPIIIEEGPAHAATFRSTSIKTEFIELAPAAENAPKSRAEAALQQLPHVDILMHKLCKELAMCGLSEEHGDIEKLFHDRRVEHMKKFAQSGNKKVYKINFRRSRERSSSTSGSGRRRSSRGNP